MEADIILQTFITCFHKVSLKLTFFKVVTDIPEDFTLEGEKFSSSDVELVTNAFPDIAMTAISHNAVGYIFAHNGHYSEALERSDQALALSQSTDFSIKVMARQAWISNAIGDHTSACEGCENVFALSKTAEDEADETKKKSIEVSLASIRQTYATALFALERHSEAIEAWERALADEFTTFIFSRLMQCYAAAGDYQGFISRLRKLDRDQRANWLNNLDMNNFDHEDERCFNHVAKAAGEKDVLVQVYREAIEAAKNWPFMAELLEIQARFRLAYALWRVFGDEDAAYRELNDAYDVLYSDGVSENDNETFEDILPILKIRVNKLFSELIFSRIHASPVRWVKRLLLQDLERVAKPPTATRGSGYELLGFTYSTLRAKAYLDHGRKKDALDILDPIFANSVAALRDDTGGNDAVSFRLLARILAYMSLDRPAQIAYSAQFSQVNPTFDHERVGPSMNGEDTARSTTEPKANETSITDRQGSEQVAGSADTKGAESTHRPSLEPSYEEDLEEGQGASCDGCRTSISRWTQSFYTCMVCADVDLCEACHAQQVARNNGQPFTFWYDYCGENHTYLKGPLEGWAGVKDGIMSIGEEKIKFEHWLGDVEREWHGLGVDLALKRRGTSALRHAVRIDEE